jgi:hypothetical protein
MIGTMICYLEATVKLAVFLGSKAAHSAKSAEVEAAGYSAGSYGVYESFVKAKISIVDSKAYRFFSPTREAEY